jgi:phage-related protein
MSPVSTRSARRRWRYYRTASGRKIVKEQLDKLPDEDYAEVVAAMREVRREGRSAAKHVRGDIWEVKAPVGQLTYRVLFSEEGAQDQILLALELFAKKTRTTPGRLIDLAEKRLREWRKGGR